MRLEYTLRYVTKSGSAEMDAYNVADSIVGFSQYSLIVSNTLYGTSAEFRPSIVDLNHGSFEIKTALEVAGLLVDGVKQFGSVLSSSIELFKSLKGEKPTSAKRIGGDVEVTTNSGNVTIIQTEVLNIVGNPSAGRAAHSFIRKPLQSIDRLEILDSERQRISEVNRKDADLFSPIDFSTPLLEQENTVILELRSAQFREGNKWRVFDGVNPFWVIIEDEAFIQQVELGRVRFGKGDKLTCVMKTFQTRDSSGNLATERIVKKVIHHEIFRPPPQML